MDTERTERNRKVVLDMYAAGIRGDLAGMLSHMHEQEFVLNEPAFLPYGGVYRGVEAMAAAFAKIAEYLDVASIEIDHVVAEDDYVFVVMRARDRRSGEMVLLAEENRMRDGKIAEMRIFFHEARSLVAAGSVA